MSTRMDEDSLPEFEAVKILKQVLEGIKFMHDSGFMHLDLKVSVRTSSSRNTRIISKPGRLTIS